MPSTGALTVIGIFIAALGILIYPTAVFYMDMLGINKNVTDFNTEYCSVIKAVECCEDVALHGPSGKVFMPCKDCSDQAKWFPPMDDWDKSANPASGQVHVFDLNVSAVEGGIHVFSCQGSSNICFHRPFQTDTFTTLKLVNFDLPGLHPHGLSILQSPTDPTLIHLALINHRFDGSVVELFDHHLNTDELVHVRTVSLPELVWYPNNVVLVGPRSFYVSNPLWSMNKFVRIFERFLRLKSGHVVFYDGEGKEPKAKIVADKLMLPNGLDISADGKKVFVAQTVQPGIRVYERKPNNNLRFIEDIDLTDFFLPDNIFVDKRTGSIYAAGFPQALKLDDAHAIMIESQGKGDVSLCSQAVARISNNTAEDRFYGKKYQTELSFSNSGAKLKSGTSTGIIVDSERNKSVIGAVYGPPVVCTIAF
ncbi:Serum paraoxonase/arylesterase 2 [Quaeritorhiza haematococci]|nr:Serum paraoxonase/arylesterase 2 [Quaeritorhiza haematococci]